MRERQQYRWERLWSTAPVSLAVRHAAVSVVAMRLLTAMLMPPDLPDLWMDLSDLLGMQQPRSSNPLLLVSTSPLSDLLQMDLLDLSDLPADPACGLPAALLTLAAATAS